MTVATRYDLAEFVDDFNGAKPLNLENVRLGTAGTGAWMEVDGRRVRFLDCRLTTFGSLVNLTGRMGEDQPEIKFEYDGRTAVARFKGHPLVEFMQVYGDRLGIHYAHSRDEKHVHWTDLNDI